jgi:peroxiredoxin
MGDSRGGPSDRKRTRRHRALAALVVCAAVLVADLAGAQDPFKELALIRSTRVQPAHDFTVPTPEGKSITLAGHRGRVVFLNFWATWCPPCREEMPAMERLYQRFKDKGFVVLAISVDAEGAPAVTPFVNEHRFTYPVGLDPKMALAGRYGVRALPSSFLVDRRGKLAATALGPREWDSEAAHALVASLLAQP